MAVTEAGTDVASFEHSEAGGGFGGATLVMSGMLGDGSGGAVVLGGAVRGEGDSAGAGAFGMEGMAGALNGGEYAPDATSRELRGTESATRSNSRMLGSGVQSRQRRDDPVADLAAVGAETTILYPRGPIADMSEEHAGRRDRFAPLDAIQPGWSVELRQKAGSSVVGGVNVNKQSTDVAYPPPFPRICISIHTQRNTRVYGGTRLSPWPGCIRTQGWSCSNLLRVLVLNDPPAWWTPCFTRPTESVTSPSPTPGGRP